jgi:ankyrin repeat protein
MLAAARHGHLKAVRLLLDLGVPVNGTDPHGLTALHVAAERGHRLVVDHLLERGASLDLRDRVYDGTPLGRATWFSRRWPTPERVEVRRALAQRSTDAIQVVYAGSVDRLAALLTEDPARATTKRSSGWTALHELAQGEIPEWEPLLALLLRHGADPEARTNDGRTSLDVATAAQADDVAAALSRVH